jgi:hypothetical protein
MIDAFFLCFVGITALLDTWHLGEKRFAFFGLFRIWFKSGWKRDRVFRGPEPWHGMSIGLGIELMSYDFQTCLI